MRFLADVNIPQSIIDELKKHGHDVLDGKISLLNSPDVNLINISKKGKRIILTRDKDFVALTQHPQYKIPAIVMRSKIQSPEYLLDLLLDLIENQDETLLDSSLTIVKDYIAR